MIRRLLPFSAPALLSLVAACSQPSEPEGCAEDCFTPPAPICNGDVLTSFSPLGACEEDRCVYPPVTADCAAQGGTCEAGACVLPEDPCEGVRCDAPPEAACEGDTLVTWAEAGECNGETGECEYARTDTDCLERNQICNNARCIAAADPCVDVVCEDEPDDTCEGNVAVRFNEAGTCDGGTCVYSESARVDCDTTDGVCVNGRCTPRDPCEDVVCNEPPAATCDGDIANGYDALGTCLDGVCRYIDAVENCAVNGEVCVDGACQPPDPCVGVRCNLPPAPRCDDTEAVTYATVGICDDGFCTYPATRQNCAETGERCLSGACVPSAGPCEGVVCDDPPAPECDGDVLTEYTAPGTCAGGTCSYSASPFDCATIGRVCDAGECVLADPLCDGVFCGAAPENTCDEDGQFLTDYVGTNSCVAGECVAPFETIDCFEMGMVCNDGACAPRDTCAGVVCRLPDRCEGGDAIRYSADGACSEGICDYAAVESRTNCGTLGLPCFDGACQRQVDTLEYGDIVITEIMPAPASGDPLDAWFEVENRSGRDIDLLGLQISGSEEGTENSVVESSFVVPAGGFAIFSASFPGPNPAVPTYVLDEENFVMDELSDEVYLGNGEGLVAFVEFDAESSGYTRGVSTELDASLTSLALVADPSSWCAARRLDPVGEVSTAGRRGDACTARLAAGALVVSEVLLDGRGLRPQDSYQWFEFLNLTGSNISLGGVVVENEAGDWYSFPASVVVADGRFAVVGNGASSPALVDARFAHVLLDADGGVLRLVQGPVTVDTVVLSESLVPGPNMSVGIDGDITADRNDEVSNWCPQQGVDGGTGVGTGTPGSRNACLD